VEKGISIRPKCGVGTGKEGMVTSRGGDFDLRFPQSVGTLRKETKSNSRENPFAKIKKRKGGTCGLEKGQAASVANIAVPKHKKPEEAI